MPPGAVPGSICSDHDEYHDIVAKTLISLDVPQVAQDFGDSHSVAHYCQTRSKTRPTDQDEFHATDWRSPIPADTHRDSIHFRVAPSCCTSSQICVSDQDECDVTAMKFPIPADTHSIPSHGTATGRKGETGCGARSSRDGLTADLECDGTHYNFPVTLESGEAIEDMTKDDVEHLVVMLREVVDVLYRRQKGELILVVDTMIDRLINGVTGKYIRRKTRHPPNFSAGTQHHDIAADDSDSDQGGMEALVHGTPSRYATPHNNRSVHWPQVRPRSLTAERHSDTSCDNGAAIYSREDEESDHDSHLAGRGGVCLVCEVYSLPLSRPTQCSLCEEYGMYMLWCEGCCHFTCPECYDAEVDGWRFGSQGSYED